MDAFLPVFKKFVMHTLFELVCQRARAFLFLKKDVWSRVLSRVLFLVRDVFIDFVTFLVK